MATINGTNLVDMLMGTMMDDIIHGKNGDDVISGGDGNNKVFGEMGNDYLAGGEGNNLLSGAAGNDFLQGGHGQDTLDGGAGADLINVGSGEGVLAKGGPDNDAIFASSSSSSSSSSSGMLSGDAGNDGITFSGSYNALGGSGDDKIIFGGPAGSEEIDDLHSTIDGGSGNDVIVIGSFDGTSFLEADGLVVNGSSGAADTLLLGGDGNIDFTQIDDQRIKGIEVLDLEHTVAIQGVIMGSNFSVVFQDIVVAGINEVTLGVNDVINLSNSTNTLTILGDSMDTVNLEGFTDTGKDQKGSGGHIYSVYHGGAATVLVDNDIGTVMTS